MNRLMSSDAIGPRDNPLLNDDVRRYLASLGGGYRLWSRDKRSLMGKLLAERKWATRRAKYGPTGQRPKSYKKWREDRGYPPINDDGSVNKPG